MPQANPAALTLSAVQIICRQIYNSGDRQMPTSQSSAQPAKTSAYAHLRGLIVKGEMAPATRLSEPELAVRMGIGRSRIREALLRLEQEGFIVRGSSGRISVAPLEIPELQQLY